MSEYAKIQTLFDRGPDFAVDTTRIRRPAFAAIDRWWVDEKLDGQNIRLIYRRDDGDTGWTVDVCGRTDRAVLRADLTDAIKGQLVFPAHDAVLRPGQIGLVVYGEGLGPKINGNPHRLTECAFRVFDIRPIVALEPRENLWCSDGTVGYEYPERLSPWLDRADVRAVAAALGLAMVPEWGEWMQDDVVRMVRWHATEDDVGSGSYLGEHPWRGRFEGVVCRPLTELCDGRRDRVIFKLKVRDFRIRREDV